MSRIRIVEMFISDEQYKGECLVFQPGENGHAVRLDIDRHTYSHTNEAIGAVLEILNAGGKVVILPTK